MCRFTLNETDLDLLVGFGTIFEDLERMATSFLYQAELTAVQQLLLSFQCVDKSLQQQELAVRHFHLGSISLIRHVIDEQVIEDARRIAGEDADSVYVPVDAAEFCNRIFHTCYMGTENSSTETRKRAKDLAAAIGA